MEVDIASNFISLGNHEIAPQDSKSHALIDQPSKLYALDPGVMYVASTYLLDHITLVLKIAAIVIVVVVGAGLAWLVFRMHSHQNYACRRRTRKMQGAEPKTRSTLDAGPNPGMNVVSQGCDI